MMKMIFCIIHAGQNKLTNITMKSILHFHPQSKIFIVDVTSKEGWLSEKFHLIDESISKNLEIVQGIPREDLKLQSKDISCLNMNDFDKGCLIDELNGN